MTSTQFPPDPEESGPIGSRLAGMPIEPATASAQIAGFDKPGYPTKGWVTCRVGSFELETDWIIEPGEVLVLFGPSGAGKTTTLRAVAGLLRPRQGQIEVGGRIVYDGSGSVWVPAHRRRIGYLTQQTNLFPHLDVQKNIAYGLRGQPQGVIRVRVGELISLLQLEGMETRKPWQLSGGQQQRVALARALAPAPGLLLLDEPFAGLDMELRRILRREVRSILARSPIPVLLVTHEREEALALADAVQVIDEGHIIARGLPLDILGQPGQGRVARLVGVENLFHLRVERRNPRDGTMVCAGGGLRIEVPLEDPAVDSQGVASESDRVSVAIRASDIILSSQDLRGTSARNRLLGVVTNIEMHPPGYEITLDCGLPLRCHITGGALEEMQVRPGQAMWAVFKASSCFLVQDAGGQRNASQPRDADASQAIEEKP